MERWLYCNPSPKSIPPTSARLCEGLEATIKDCIQKAGSVVAKNIKAISVDTTGRHLWQLINGTPLALTAGFEQTKQCLCVEDHTSVKEAAEINEHAEKFDINYLQLSGGIYSTEWFWAKFASCLRNDMRLCSLFIRGRAL